MCKLFHQFLFSSNWQLVCSGCRAFCSLTYSTSAVYDGFCLVCEFSFFFSLFSCQELTTIPGRFDLQIKLIISCGPFDASLLLELCKMVLNMQLTATYVYIKCYTVRPKLSAPVCTLISWWFIDCSPNISMKNCTFDCHFVYCIVFNSIISLLTLQEKRWWR